MKDESQTFSILIYCSCKEGLSMDKEVIRLDHISKQFNQTPVLKDITAKLHKGEILGF